MGGGLAVLGALCYGALAARLRESGGEYLFLSRTLHPALGFVAGWVSLWAGFTAPIAVAAAAFGAYGTGLLGLDGPHDAHWLGTGVLLLAAASQLGASFGARAQNTIVAAKVIALATLAGFGLWSLRTGLPTAPTDVGAFELPAFATAVMWISMSYSGWNGAVYVAGEVRDVERTLPRALLLGTLTTTVLYLALNAFFVFSAPVAELTQSGNIEQIAANAANARGGVAFATAVRLVIVVALFTSLTSNLMAGPRVYARMAEDGVFPAAFRIGDDAPRLAIAMQAALSLAVLWWTNLRQLLGYVGFTLAMSTALAVVGLIVLRRREGPERVPIPGWPWLPAVFVAVTAFFGVLMFRETAAEPLAALVTIATGLVVYLVVRAYAARK